MTIVAFLIIVVAMAKNVLAGAYCAYPKWWDKVDAAHKEVEGVGWFTQIGGTVAAYKDFNSGTLRNAIMRLLPNIKTLTDFEGDTVSPKKYFIRAIPLMIGAMIIGAFIYNGYYRDTAAKVVDFGSTIIERTLLEVDPIAVYDQFTGSSGRPTFASDNSEVPKQKLVNSIATNIYSKVIGEYNDIESAEAKRALATTIENKVLAWLDELEGYNTEYMDGKSWKSILQVNLTNGMVSIESINNVPYNEGAGWQYALTFPTEELGFSSNINIGVPLWVRIRLNFEKNVVKTGTHAVTDITLHLPAGSYTGATLSVEGARLQLQGTNGVSATVEAQSAEVKVVYDKPRGEFTFEWPNGVPQGGALSLKQSLSLVDSQRALTHKITTIVFDSTSGAYLSSETEKLNNFDFTKEDLGVVTN
jgi:hypothetical protein